MENRLFVLNKDLPGLNKGTIFKTTNDGGSIFPKLTDEEWANIKVEHKYPISYADETNFFLEISEHNIPEGLEEAISFIKSGKMPMYGYDKMYFFVLDEDGQLSFLKRTFGEEQNDERWPVNEYDGEVLFSVDVRDGVETAELFLSILGIEILS